MKKYLPVFCCLFLVVGSQASPCTIVSGKSGDGVVWAGNNEDYYFDFNTYVNVLPAEGDLLGAVSFTYGSPETFVEGGVNEHGLFFDFNWIPTIATSDVADWGDRRAFPGGEDALVVHILRTCSSVQEAVAVIKKYDFDLADAQMHLADRYGGLAIVNASGVRLANTNHQLSTNFNVLTGGPSSGGRVCWRYPIAEEILATRSIGLQTIREALDATQQRRVYGTIYSNVINLTTGDIYNYYAGDFEHVFHFKLGDILKEGKRSYLFRSLFADQPIVRIWETYQAKGAHEAVALLRELSDALPPPRRAETLRHLFSSCLLRLNRFEDARIFFDEWLKVTEGRDQATSLYGALIHLSSGDYGEARSLLEKQLEVDAADQLGRKVSAPFVRDLLARLDGERPEGANARFELAGHGEAGFVALFLVDEAAVLHFLLKGPEGWHGEFALPRGRNPYAFVIDGERVFDPSNPRREMVDTEDGQIELNIRVVN